MKPASENSGNFIMLIFYAFCFALSLLFVWGTVSGLKYFWEHPLF